MEAADIVCVAGPDLARVDPGADSAGYQGMPLASPKAMTAVHIFIFVIPGEMFIIKAPARDVE